MYRLRFVVSVLVVGLLTSGFLLGEDKKADPKEPVFIKATLPRYYKQLGLSDKQKKNVYTIRASYAAKVEELQRQIADLKIKEKSELESVLTGGQKARLKELLGGKASKDSEVKETATEAKKK